MTNNNNKSITIRTCDTCGLYGVHANQIRGQCRHANLLLLHPSCPMWMPRRGQYVGVRRDCGTCRVLRGVCDPAECVRDGRHKEWV